MRKSLTIIGIILSTILLAVLAVVTAVRIKNLGTKPVAPSAPESKPAAVETVPPDTAVPEVADCKKTFTAAELPVTITCKKKESHRNDSRNTAGHYYVDTASLIKEGDTVSKGEIIVFGIHPSPQNVTKAVTYTDVLPQSLTYMDNDAGCQYNAGMRTLTCNDINTNSGKYFRAKIADNASGTITNTAKVKAGDDPESTCSATLKVASTPSTSPSPSPSVTPTATSTPGPSSLCEYLQADKAGGSAPLTVKYSGKGFDPVRVKGFRFHFGDGEKREFFGSFTSSQVQEVEYTYRSAGKYKAYLEIMDDGDHWKTRPECEVTISVDGTSTPSPTTTKTVIAKEPTPTEAQLLEAGIKIPTLGGIIIGFLLISFGVALVF